MSSSPAMTLEQRDTLVDYIGRLRASMSLQDWTIDLGHEPTESPDHAADVDITYGRRHARMRVGFDFMLLSPEKQRHCIVHEMIHLHFGMMNTTIRDAVQQASDTRSGFALFDSVYKTQMEFAVDAIADGWAKYFPVIPWSQLGEPDETPVPIVTEGEEASKTPDVIEP